VGLQNLILGLGTALVAIAVAVFTAMNWSQLDASVQGLLMVALTVAGGVAAAVAARRSMPSTAEALGTVAVLLALADVHAFRVGLAPGADPALFWASGVAIVAAAAWVLGRASSIRSPQIVASVLAQLPLLFVLEGLGATVGIGQLAVVAQSVLVLFALDRFDVPRWARRVGSSWAVGASLVLTTTVVVSSQVSGWFSSIPDVSEGMVACCLAAAGALALQIAWLRAEDDEIRVLAMLTAPSLGLGAVWFAGLELADPATAGAALALGAALVLLGGLRLPKAWGTAPAIVGGFAAPLALLPLIVSVSSMLVASSTVTPEAWTGSGSTLASAFQAADAPALGAVAIGLDLVAVLVLALGLARRAGAPARALALAATALTGLVVSPLLAPLTVTGTVLVALAAVAVGTVLSVLVAGRRSAFPIAVGSVALAYAWATPWSLATPGLTFATLGTGIAAAIAVGVVARKHEAVGIATSAAAWVAAASPLLAGLVAWDHGVGVAMACAVAAATAAVVSIVGVVLLDPSGRASRRPVPDSELDGVVSWPTTGVMALAVEATSLLGYVGAFLATVGRADPQATSLALAAGALGFGLHAARPGRRVLGVVAAIELIVLIWLQLGQAQVHTAEAYTLPLAFVLLAAGLAGAHLDRKHGGDPGSWITFGPALLVGLAPTVWFAFTLPGTLRPLLGLVAGALVLIGGVAWGKKAMVDVGTATVVALGLRQIAPVAGEIPNWAAIGATGIVLLAVGATFEQRRRDLKAVLRKYSALT
jgi:hypothetical protein